MENTNNTTNTRKIQRKIFKEIWTLEKENLLKPNYLENYPVEIEKFTTFYRQNSIIY